MNKIFREKMKGRVKKDKKRGAHSHEQAPQRNNERYCSAIDSDSGSSVGSPDILTKSLYLDSSFS